MEFLNFLSRYGTDIVIIVILIISAIVGFNSGFIKSLISTFGSLIAMVVALLLCSAVTAFLESKFGVVTAISEWVSGVLSQIFGEEIMTKTLQESSEISLTETNLSAWIIKIVIDMKGTGDIPLDKTISQVVSPVFAYYITCVISFVGLTIIIKIILFFISLSVKKLHEIALVGTLDKGLGLLFGLIRGVLIAQIIIVVVGAIPLDFCQQLKTIIDQSVIAGFINKINLFAYIFNAVSDVNLLETVKALIIK